MCHIFPASSICVHTYQLFSTGFPLFIIPPILRHFVCYLFYFSFIHLFLFDIYHITSISSYNNNNTNNNNNQRTDLPIETSFLLLYSSHSSRNYYLRRNVTSLFCVWWHDVVYWSLLSSIPNTLYMNGGDNVAYCTCHSSTYYILFIIIAFVKKYWQSMATYEHN